MHNKILTGVALFATAAVKLCSYGTTNYWDNNGSNAGFGAAGGIWGVDVNWSADSLGTSVPAITNTTADDVLYFGTLNDGLAAGTVTVEGADQAFKTMIFEKASGEITIDGGELELAYPASTVEIHNGTNTIGSVLAGTNGLHKAGTLWHGAFLPATPVVIFPNTTLADFVGAVGFMGGGSIAGRKAANIYYFVHSGTNATFQLQVLDDVYTKCVGIELTQVGPDITAKVRYAKYVSGVQLGYNFDTGGNSSNIATAYTANGYGCAELLLLRKTGVYEGFLTASAAIAFPNATLAYVVGAEGNFAGGSILGNNVPGTVYYFANDGSTATFQLQVYNGGYTKCIKVELVQSGPDITARAVYVKYYNSLNNNFIGFDFDTGGTGNTLTTTYTTGGYGLPQLQLAHAADRSTLKLTARNTYTGKTILGKGRVEINSHANLGNGAYAGAIVNSGELVFGSGAYQTLSGPISGGGSLIKDFASSGLPSRDSQPGFVQTAPTVVITNATLSDYYGAAGVMSGGWITGDHQADAYFYSYDGIKAAAQFQILEGGYTKCVKVEFTQVGSDIAARGVYAKYTGNNQLGFDFDSGGTGGTVATSDGAAGYGVESLTLGADAHSRMILSGVNTYSGGTVIGSGVLETRSTSQALPSSGGITVNSGAELVLNSGHLDIYGGVGGNNPITLNGGKLRLLGNFNASQSRLATVNGGIIENHADTYMNNLVLQNGAQFAGSRAIRVGYTSNGNIAVSGTSPSYLNMGLTLVNGGKTLTLNVADVTGDDATDLAVTGAMDDMSGYAGLPVIKTGAGTVTLSANNNFSGRVTINAGTVALAAGSALDPANNLTLNGGTLAMGGFVNTLGTLTVSDTNSVINLGSGTLSFADSSAQSWTNRVTLTGTLIEQSVRFGDDNTGLTAAQQRAIEYNDGSSVRLDSEGYLTARPLGTIILIE